MELIRISNRRIKLMLTPTDMSHFALNTNDLDNGKHQRVRRAFRLLLAEVRRQTDFDADEECLSVQYFPSVEGGCEMFISDLGEETPMASAFNALQAAPKTALAPIPPSGGFHRDCAYRFEALSDLLRACRRLEGIGYVPESAAYRDEQGIYYLFLSVTATSPYSIPRELEFLVEYGSIENAAALRLYIREHASLIASPDAVLKLGALA